ncbi:hypothetical protein RQP46_007828 [Phenoliferia psychrophenolica]
MRGGVKIEEVNPDQDWESDSEAGSAASDSSDDADEGSPFDPNAESLADRFFALKDIVAPATRQAIADSASTTVSWIRWSAGLAGQAAWIVTTSALLVGLPAMLSIEGEGGLVMQEKEFMGQQAAPAAAFGAPAPGQPQATGVVPPGF